MYSVYGCFMFFSFKPPCCLSLSGFIVYFCVFIFFLIFVSFYILYAFTFYFLHLFATRTSGWISFTSNRVSQPSFKMFKSINKIMKDHGHQEHTTYRFSTLYTSNSHTQCNIAVYHQSMYSCAKPPDPAT